MVAGIAAAVFLPASDGGWIYDDHPLIENNPYVHSFSWWPRWFVTDFWDASEEIVRFGNRIVYWRPAITASYAIDWKLAGGHPTMFHVTNTLAHAGVGALAFFVLRRWIGSSVPALLAALLFVVHPTKAESVAWIAGRTDVFCMLAIFVATQGIARRLQGRPGGLVLEVLGTLAAYLTKEQAIVLPAFVAVEAWVAAGRPSIDMSAVRRMVIAALPQAGVAVGYLVLRRLFMPIKAVGVDSHIPLFDHVQAVFETLGRFTTLTLVPHDLSIQQGLVRLADGRPTHSTTYVVIGVVALGLLAAAAVLARRRWPFLTVGILFYAITLAPTSNLIYTDMATLVSERFLYLPFLGVALIVGLALTRTSSRLAKGIVIVAILVTGTQAALRAADYRDERRFWARELDLHPESPLARNFQINEAVRQKRNKQALVLTLKLTELSVGFPDAGVAVQLAELLSRLVPDRDVEALRAIDTFCASLIERSPSPASIAVWNVQFSIPTQTRLFEKSIAKLKSRIVAVRVDIMSRLGEDARAVALAEQEFARCPSCSAAVMMTALARARSGNYLGAIAILDAAADVVPAQLLGALRLMVDAGAEAHDRAENAPAGPAKLQARATELSALELWGRAYEVLAPYKAEIVKAPKVAFGFAELAFRAGEPDVSREVLTASRLPPHEVDALLASWNEKMGWAD